MAQAVTTNPGILALLKEQFTEHEFQSLFDRNSPTLEKIPRTFTKGLNYNFAMGYGRGGAVSADFRVAKANAANMPQNQRVTVPSGKIFSIFNITQLEQLAGAGPSGGEGNFISPLKSYMFSSLEAARKTMAACLFGAGYGDLGQVGPNAGAITIGSNTISLPPEVVIKMDIGTTFQVNDTSSLILPSSALRSSINTVTAIGSAAAGSQNLPVTFTATANETWLTTDFVCLQGGRDGSGNPSFPSGLAAWIPTYYNRTGSNWATYIGTSFYNMTRSVAPNRLAGGYYQQAIGESRGNAILEGLRIQRRAGGKPDMIVMNDITYKLLIEELGAQTSYFQNINTAPAKSDENVVNKGVGSLGFMFSNTWVQYVIDDPYCPQNIVYIMDSKTIEFITYTKADEVMADGVAGMGASGSPGRPNPNDTQEPDNKFFAFLIDNWLANVPGAESADGLSDQVSLTIFGNFVLYNTANYVAVQLN